MEYAAPLLDLKRLHQNEILSRLFRTGKEEEPLELQVVNPGCVSILLRAFNDARGGGALF